MVRFHDLVLFMIGAVHSCKAEHRLAQGGLFGSARAKGSFQLRLRGGADSDRNGFRQAMAGDAIVERRILDTVSNTWTGASPEGWDIPDGALMVATVPEAVEEVLEGVCDRVFVGKGRHEWPGSRLIVGDWRADEALPSEGGPSANSSGEVRALEITGEEQARLWGMWFMEPGSRGRMDGLTAAFRTTIGMVGTVEVWGGPWAMEAMEVRSAGGTALKAAKEAAVVCAACGLGGLEGGDKDEYGRWVGSPDHVTGHEGRAHFAVHLNDVSSPAPSTRTHLARTLRDRETAGGAGEPGGPDGLHARVHRAHGRGGGAGAGRGARGPAALRRGRQQRRRLRRRLRRRHGHAGPGPGCHERGPGCARRPAARWHGAMLRAR